MIPYLIPLFLYLILCFIAKKDKVLYIASFFLFALLPAFRYNVGGTDYFIYEQAYNNQDLKFEPFYNLTAFLFYESGMTFNIFLCLITLACFTFLLYSIKKNTSFFYLAFLIYLGKLYIFYDFVILRQFLAMPFIWIALTYLRDDNKKRFFLFWSIGFLFHYSAIFILPIYFIRNKIISTKFIIISLLIGLSSGFFFIKIIQFLCNNIPYIAYRLNAYLEKSSSANLFNFIEISLIIGIILIYRAKFNKLYKHSNFYLNLLWFSALLLFIFSSLEDIKRARDYFIVAYFMILPLIPSLFKKKHVKIFIYCLLSFYFTMLYIRSILLFDETTSVGKLIPYNIFIQ